MRAIFAALSGILLAACPISSVKAAENSSGTQCSSEKVLLLIKRKPGMSPDEFRQYYENIHAPMALKLLGRFIMDYRRNFIQHGATGKPERELAGYDVITEIRFRDENARKEMAAFTARPEIRSIIEEDEKKFMDRPLNRRIIVSECRN